MANIMLNDVVLLFILTILHVLAIVYTWKVGSVFNSKSWNFIVAALIVLLINRLISFLDVFGIAEYSGTIVLIDSIYVPLVFLVLIVVGMMRIFYKIESSMEMEKKIKSVEKKRRRRYW